MTDNVCPDCMTGMPQDYRFCGQCGASMVGTGSAAACWVIDLLDGEGRPIRTVPVLPGEQVLGRAEKADIVVDDDPALSPLHALIALREDAVSIEDRGSRNGVFMPIEENTALEHNDLVRAGGQLFRFQLISRLGADSVVPLPHPAFGPSRPPWGRLLRYNRHGQVTNARVIEADTFQVGRRRGDWVLSKARTLSGSHFAIQRDEEGQVTITDCGSRNGTFIEMRSAKVASDGEHFLVGDRSIKIRNVSLNAYHAVLNANESVQVAEEVSPDEIGLNQAIAAIPEELIDRALANADQMVVESVAIPSPEAMDELLNEIPLAAEEVISDSLPPVELSNPAIPALPAEAFDQAMVAQAAPLENYDEAMVAEAVTAELIDGEDLLDDASIADLLKPDGVF